jgi:DNA-binding NarL/FixJ family response regulator
VGYKIMLVDDHQILRDGLMNLIAKMPFTSEVVDAASGAEALQQASKFLPDIAIMDIAMPGMNGIETTKKLLEICPATKVIALSMHSDKSFIVEALKAGAKGYLLKDSAFEELTQAIRAVMENRVYLSAQVKDTIALDLVTLTQTNQTSALQTLTKRESEVLKLIADGNSTKEIAFLLNVSIKTVETHRQQIMAKLNIFSIAELTKYAIREGLTKI